MHTYKDIDNYAVKQKSPAKPITYKKDAARMPRPFTDETHRPKSDAKIDGFYHLCKCNAEKIRKTEFKRILLWIYTLCSLYLGNESE